MRFRNPGAAACIPTTIARMQQKLNFTSISFIGDNTDSFPDMEVMGARPHRSQCMRPSMVLERLSLVENDSLWLLAF